MNVLARELIACDIFLQPESESCLSISPGFAGFFSFFSPVNLSLFRFVLILVSFCVWVLVGLRALVRLIPTAARLWVYRFRSPYVSSFFRGLQASVWAEFGPGYFPSVQSPPKDWGKPFLSSPFGLWSACFPRPNKQCSSKWSLFKDGAYSRGLASCTPRCFPVSQLYRLHPLQ